MFGKFLTFIKSKNCIVLLLLVCLIVLCALFWVFGPYISFNDIYILGSPYLRFGIIFVLWLAVFLFFLLNPIVEFFNSLKSEKQANVRELKKLSKDSMFKAKRNFFMSINEAKMTWKNKIRFKKIPLVIVVGEEGAGKSTFINYSNIEYPLNDSLQSYKKFHQSTNNFSLYVSKNGALLDTEGNYFSQEKFFIPASSDEIPEDDLEKNKDFLIKKNIWNNFLNFLNKNLFHSKLNGIVLIIDVRLFLNNPKEYSQDVVRYLVKRVNDCENSLNIMLPIYIVFSKIDLLEGMKEFFAIFNENIAKKTLGISFDSALSIDSLDKDFKQLSQSLMLNFINKNHFIQSIDDKNKAYLFLKQLDNLFVLAKNFILETQKENAFKNNSSLRGVYFVSAYQENIPRNFLLDGICEKYDIKKALAKIKPFQNKNGESYFVRSLLEDIIFRDYYLSNVKNIFKKFYTLLLVFIICFSTYSLSFFLISKNKAQKQKAENALLALDNLLNGIDPKKLSIEESANLLADLLIILGVYPELLTNSSVVEYVRLNISYKGFLEARDFYYKLNEYVLKNTLITEMEFVLKNAKNDDNKDNIIKTLYVYKSLFEEKFLNKDLIKVWIEENWQLLSKYKIQKEHFLSGIEQMNMKNLNMDKKSVLLAIRNLQITTTRSQILYVLLKFLNNEKRFYTIKEELGFSANVVFSESSKIYSIDKIYTKSGLISFVKYINECMDNVLEIESWLLGHNDSFVKENKNMLHLNILKLYLAEYKHKWESILQSIEPKKYDTKESMLNELDILSRKDNPISTLINIVSYNTNLNDVVLLREAYNTTLNASEVKILFVNIANFFVTYHKISQQDSLLSAGASAVGINMGDDEKVMESISMDIKNIQNKIMDFSTNNSQSVENKIIYALNDKKEQDDAFVIFSNDVKKLPSAIEKYYSILYSYAWNIVEMEGISLLNKAWHNEIYMPFMSDIAPFYPFNSNSTQELSMDSLKGFFGRQGTLNNFYDKYLSSILLKGTNAYSPNTRFDTKINFSKAFLDFMRESKTFSDLMLDSNNNIKLSFTLQSLDLSSDFSFVELQYDTQTMKYDHTLRSTMQIIVDQFNHNTILALSAFGYYNSKLNYSKTYNGIWAWHRFLKENKNTNSYSAIFNDNEKLYFDFLAIGNNQEVSQVLRAPQQIKIVERITIE